MELGTTHITGSGTNHIAENGTEHSLRRRRMPSPAWIAKAALCLSLAVVTTSSVHAQDPTGQTQDSRPGTQEPGDDIGHGPGMRHGGGRGIRGTVVSTSGGNITIQTDRGESWVVVTTSNTRIRIDRQPVKAADLQPGDAVMAMGKPDPDTRQIHAMAIMGASAAQVAKMKADLGKTYIVGRITAMEGTNLTILRPDKVSQTITLDETTSLRHGGRMPGEAMGMMGGMGPGGMGPGGMGQADPGGPGNAGRGRNGGNAPDAEGEAITVADVHIGDRVGGTGSLKGNTFVPTELHVMAPRGPRGGGMGNGAGGGTDNGTAPEPQQ